MTVTGVSYYIEQVKRMPYDYVSTLDPAILQRARDELGETEQRLQQSYDLIREWLKKQPHLAKCPVCESTNSCLQSSEKFQVQKNWHWLLKFIWNNVRKYDNHSYQSIAADFAIVGFIRGCKYNLEKVKRKLDCNMTMRGALPEFFSGWNPFDPTLQAILKLGYNFFLKCL